LALAATICIYTGVHTLYYGSTRAALAPAMFGTALLAAIFMCLRFAEPSFRRWASLSRGLIIRSQRAVQEPRFPSKRVEDFA
jgi:hypothetical protein